jgi:hypothetical protein
LAAERARKRAELLDTTEAELVRLQHGPDHLADRGRTPQRVARPAYPLLGRRKMA